MDLVRGDEGVKVCGCEYGWILSMGMRERRCVCVCVGVSMGGSSPWG